MSTVWLIDLESVETRYTKEWKTYLPKLLKKHGHTVNVVEGPKDIPNATTPGAFLNFGGTNIYKAKQVELISRAFTSGAVKDGDHFLFTDAWHPGIINLKYMAELLGVKIITHALWHAGSYDPEDFLGRLIGNSPWVRNAEKSFFHAYDHNYDYDSGSQVNETFKVGKGELTNNGLFTAIIFMPSMRFNTSYETAFQISLAGIITSTTDRIDFGSEKSSIPLPTVSILRKF